MRASLLVTPRQLLMPPFRMAWNVGLLVKHPTPYSVTIAEAMSVVKLIATGWLNFNWWAMGWQIFLPYMATSRQHAS